MRLESQIVIVALAWLACWALPGRRTQLWCWFWLWWL